MTVTIMHRIHAILDDQKKRHHEDHRKLKRVSLIIFLLMSLLIAGSVLYVQMYLSELSNIVVNTSQ